MAFAARHGEALQHCRSARRAKCVAEPFGSVGPAAAAAGIPAAAFDVGGISEWLTEGVSGHLAPGQRPTAKGLAGATARCLADPHHYAALKEGARMMSQRFTMQHHIPALVSALEQATR